MSEKILTRPREQEPLPPCEFCGSEGADFIFWTGEKRDIILGGVCLECIWKALNKVLNKKENKKRDVDVVTSSQLGFEVYDDNAQ